MPLRLGDSGRAVKRLQGGLNKFGALLLVDGDFGPLVRDAVLDTCATLGRPASPDVDDELQTSILDHPDPFPLLTSAGITFIARAEVSGPREYRRRYKHPVWPSVESGITIGIGYDLQFTNRSGLFRDWEPHLPVATIGRLAETLGKPGSADSLAAVRDIEIPLPVAMSVFVGQTLPLYVERTRSVYPQLDMLPPARRTALVSLVYNRGTRLTDTDPVRQNRREMRTIRDLLAAGDFDGVASELDSMARLWTLRGLIQRRHDEAKLWRSGFEALQLG
jgi:hypothetical protein